MAVKHRKPPNGKEHWAIGQDGKLHATAPNAQAVCGASTTRVVHYRQVNEEGTSFCDDCLEQTDG